MARGPDLSATVVGRSAQLDDGRVSALVGREAELRWLREQAEARRPALLWAAPRAGRSAVLSEAARQLGATYVDLAPRGPVGLRDFQRLLADLRVAEPRALVLDGLEQLLALTQQRPTPDPFTALLELGQLPERSLLLGARPVPELRERARVLALEQRELGPVDAAELIEALTASLGAERATRCVELLGGRAADVFLGAAALAREPTLEVEAVLERELFSGHGVLGLLCAREHEAAVRSSTFLASTLRCLAERPKRVVELAAELEVASGAAAAYLERLADLVGRDDHAHWSLTDPLLQRWLLARGVRARSAIVRALGTTLERAVAEGLDVELSFLFGRKPRRLLGTVRSAAVELFPVPDSPLLELERPLLATLLSEADAAQRKLLVAAVGSPQVRLFDPRLGSFGRRVRLGASALRSLDEL